jgi:hypothetical protein
MFVPLRHDAPYASSLSPTAARTDPASAGLRHLLGLRAGPVRALRAIPAQRLQKLDNFGELMLGQYGELER